MSHKDFFSVPLQQNSLNIEPLDESTPCNDDPYVGVLGFCFGALDFLLTRATSQNVLKVNQ